MKKSIFIVLICCFSLMLSAQQETYSRVIIYTDSKTPAQLFATGIEINKADRNNQWFIAEISQSEINTIAAAGFRYEVLIPDMEKFYTSRFNEKTPITDNDRALNEEWPQPVNFSLGTCGGFSTIDEMIAQLDLMHSLYPSLISVKHPLSDTVTTNQGINIYYVRISDNPEVTENEPEVLYSGMHHAREPIGMQHLLYYMWYLLENYNSDPSIKHLVDNTQMYFVPVFNIDGYTYNITTNPAGGGSWRKNRRNNGDGSYGIDVNRNYGYQWGYDNTGSSPNPSSDLFRGTAPFSEPETRMMKYFCEAHNFQIALNYHSFSNLFLYAWGWSPTPPPDNTIFDIYAQQMTHESKYTYGPANTTIYPTNGGSDDWMYGEQTTKPLTYAYTPEIGSDNDGFWPTQQRIIPLIQENMLTSLTAARLVGEYATVSDASPLFIYNQSGFLPFVTRRLGLKDGSFIVSIIPLGNSFASVGTSKVFQNLTLLEKRTDSISYQLSNTLQVGDTIQYILKIENGYFAEYDTVKRIFGFPFTVFHDNLTNATNWAGNWGITNLAFFSPPSSMTDSPTGNYTANTDKSATLISNISLPSSLMMVLQYRAKWTIEKGYDYVQVSISQNNGLNWTPIQGNFTVPGNVNQAFNQPLYDGIQGDWIREAISLNAYMGKNVKFRFRLKSDAATEFDGFYFDDFNISMLLDPTAVNTGSPQNSVLGNPYPNPASSDFKIDYSLPESTSSTKLILTSPNSIEVSSIPLDKQQGNATVDVSKLAKGIYFIHLFSEEFQSPVRKLVVK